MNAVISNHYKILHVKDPALPSLHCILKMSERNLILYLIMYIVIIWCAFGTNSLGGADQASRHFCEIKSINFLGLFLVRNLGFILHLIVFSKMVEN